MALDAVPPQEIQILVDKQYLQAPSAIELTKVSHALYKLAFEMSPAGKDVAVSAPSLMMVMGMTMLFLPETERGVILDKLGLREMGEQRMHEIFRFLLQRQRTGVVIDNLLVRHAANLPQEKREELAFYYSVAELYFEEEATTQEIADKVNSWISDRTEGLIPKLIGPELLQEMSLLFINTIFFEGSWKAPFEPTTGPFMSMIDTTSKLGHIPFGEEHLPVLLKEYHNNEVVAIFIDLQQTDPVTAYQAICADPAPLTTLFALSPSKISLRIPKTEIKYRNENILENLKEYPLCAPFVHDPRLRLGKIVQEVVLKIDEAGTTAAAATAAIIKMTSQSDPIATFHLDGPFTFILLEKETKMPLIISLLKTSSA